MGAALPFIGAASSLIGAAGTAGLFGKKANEKSRASGMSPAMQSLENTIAQYYQNKFKQPTTFTPMNPMSMNAANILSSMYLGTPYTQPGLGRYDTQNMRPYQAPQAAPTNPFSAGMAGMARGDNRLDGLAGGRYYSPR